MWKKILYSLSISADVSFVEIILHSVVKCGISLNVITQPESMTSLASSVSSACALWISRMCCKSNSNLGLSAVSRGLSAEMENGGTVTV